MANRPLWTFHGYCTPAGGRDVQEWFDALPDDSRDEIRDTVGYLEHLPIAQWRRPDFEHMGEGLSEVRCRVNTLKQVVRIYGTFAPEGVQHSYTFLLGTSAKKVTNDERSVREARRRLARLTAYEVTSHEFKFSDDPD